MTEQSPVGGATAMRKPSHAGVRRAATKIAAILPPTPLFPVEIHGVTVWAKAENLQPIGAFKIRGAWHRLTDLSEVERERGVVGVSSGNHAQGVAWAARRLGIAATIVMPTDAPQSKLAATRALGAEVVLYDRPGGEDRDAVAARLVAQGGATLVHAFGDPWVIEGQGSAGIEAAAQMRAVTGDSPRTFVACCGGGGLSAGLALACPDAQVIAVEPEGWDDVGASLASGTIQRVADLTRPTLCDALQTPATYPVNFEVLRTYGVRALSVSEAEVKAAVRFAFARMKLVVEPGGAVALAALLSGKVAPAEGMVITLSGGNVDPAVFAAIISEQVD
jgi:threonine dehydratase